MTFWWLVGLAALAFILAGRFWAETIRHSKFVLLWALFMMVGIVTLIGGIYALAMTEKQLRGEAAELSLCQPLFPSSETEHLWLFSGLEPETTYRTVGSIRDNGFVYSLVLKTGDGHIHPRCVRGTEELPLLFTVTAYGTVQAL